MGARGRLQTRILAPDGDLVVRRIPDGEDVAYFARTDATEKVPPLNSSGGPDGRVGPEDTGGGVVPGGTEQGSASEDAWWGSVPGGTVHTCASDGTVLEYTVVFVLEYTTGAVLGYTVLFVLEYTMGAVLGYTVLFVLEDTRGAVLEYTVRAVLEDTAEPVLGDTVGVPTQCCAAGRGTWPPGAREAPGGRSGGLALPTTRTDGA
jgi:hypothetical protein